MEKLTIQGILEGKRRRRSRLPIHFIDQVKHISNLSIAEIMKTEDLDAWVPYNKRYSMTVTTTIKRDDIHRK